MSFDLTTLGEIALGSNGAVDGPFGSNLKASSYTESGIPVIRGSNLSLGLDEFKSDEFVYVGDDTYSRLARSECLPQDIIFTKKGTLGQTGFVPQEPYHSYLISSNQMRLRVDPAKANPKYVYYWVSSKKAIDKIRGESEHTGVPKINLDYLKKFPISLPSVSYQNSAVEILNNLNDKIALNTQTNQTLEQMAQAIFKSWFVDFDPVKAKVNGEQPEGMDAATASLFPEKLDSETGIPAGWSQGVISDIAKLNAKSWTKKNQPEQVHYVDLANTKNGVIETVTTYDFDEAPSRARRVLNSGDTIVGTVRPGNRSFAFIGKTEQPLTGSTGFAVLSPKEEFWTSFVYLATTNDDSIDEYARLADGGAYPAIKPVVVADTPCVIPTTDIAQKFWQLTGAMLKKAHQNRLENEELAKLRDTLLPKLLSGEIELGTEVGES
ncbi:restriction endonuclease subunit S [Photobacterium leiognathi]|uniref:restriction endonuclease subunit S n=1 Tax=Photobacterium leiognathi TaxID=553611 RepID=UPI002734EC62|nr:restriction endonuclease subunit S [Photobacterium leiognathi]